MFGCLNEVKKWKVNLPGNKNRVSQKFYSNQEVRENDFYRSNSRYCSCSSFSFLAVGHVKKMLLLVKKVRLLFLIAAVYFLA